MHGFVIDLLETPDKTTLCGANNNGMFSSGLFDFSMFNLSSRITFTTPSRQIIFLLTLSTTHGLISNSAILQPLNF